MTDDQATGGTESTSGALQADGDVPGSAAVQSGNERTEREWRGDWELPVGSVVIIGVLALVLWLLHRGR